MKRFHVDAGVENPDQSVGLYWGLFEAVPTVAEPDCANGMLDDPRVNSAISAGDMA